VPDLQPFRETAYAKLNLALHVRARRDDGYHELETLFAFCADGDTLSFEAADDLTLVIDGPFGGDLAADENNLVLRAARMLREETGTRAGARIALAKTLPVASGIGGGSADAAAALRGLNRLWGTGLRDDRLAALGLSLGADVPACVHSRAMRAAGVGERLTPADLGALAGLPVLLANPGVAVSTAAVFEGWDGVDRGPMPERPAACLTEGRNDLQAPAVRTAPQIEALLADLAALDPAYPPRMSGSGATCFALFHDWGDARQAQTRMAQNRPQTWSLLSTLR
jgi:4-diphosphocytidyl-2-C-methyl-D-erythritol kinase